MFHLIMTLPTYLLLLAVTVTRAQFLAPGIPFEMFFGIKLIGCPMNTCIGKCSQRSAIDAEESATFTCKCDDYCVIFGDCCYTYFTLCHLFSTTNSLITFMSNGGRMSNEDQQTWDLKYFSERSKCFRVKFESNPFIWQSILMIGECDYENTESNIQDKCEGKKSAFPNDIPVSLANEPFITFKNPYCAACNSLSEGKQLVHWRANIQCHVGSLTVIRTYADLLEHERRCFTLVTKPENSEVRKCHTGFGDTVCFNDHGSDGSITDEGPRVSERHDVEGTLTDLDVSMHDLGMTDYVDVGDNKTGAIEEYVTMISTTDLDVSMNDLDNTDYADVDTNKTGTTEEYVNMTSTSSPEAVLLEIKESYNTGDLTDEDVLKVVKENQAVLCRSYIFPDSPGGGKTYKNPHCHGCVMGWDAFRNSSKYQDGAFCSFLPGGGASPYFPDSRKVDHYHGFYKGRHVYFSSELGHVLEPILRICSQSDFFHPLTEKCEPKVCPLGTSPYHGACINNKFQLRQLLWRPPSIYLYITMIATWSGQGTDFENIASNIVKEVKSLSFNYLNLTDDPSSSMEKMSRGSKFSSLTILQQFTSSPTFVGSTTIKVEMTTPLLFGKLNDLFADLSYKLQDTTVLDIHEVYIKNYANVREMSCENTVLNKRFNLTTTSFSDFVLAMTEKGLANIEHTWFTWYSDGKNRPHVIEMSFCDEPSVHHVETYTRPTKTTTTNTLKPESTEENPIEKCHNWTTLINDTFEAIKGGVLLKSGQLLKDTQLEAGEDGSLRVCSSDVLPFRVTKLDSDPEVRFKDVLSGLALGLKLLSFFISVCRWGIHSDAVYYHLLALSSLLIDVVHLLEDSELVSSEQLLAVLLHFSWLFSIYSCLAWCSIITFSVRKVSKCTCRHLSVALIIPIATVVICATGDSNDPPWNVGYGAYDHLFSVGRDAFIYGYILPICVGYAAYVTTFVIKAVRRHVKESNGSFFVYNFVIMILMAMQFSLASIERFVDNVSIHYFYFSFSLVISWTFLTTSISPVHNLDRTSRYLDSASSTVTVN